jgi:hypothetical protein
MFLNAEVDSKINYSYLLFLFCLKPQSKFTTSFYPLILLNESVSPYVFPQDPCNLHFQRSCAKKTCVNIGNLHLIFHSLFSFEYPESPVRHSLLVLLYPFGYGGSEGGSIQYLVNIFEYFYTVFV